MLLKSSQCMEQRGIRRVEVCNRANHDSAANDPAGGGAGSGGRSDDQLGREDDRLGLAVGVHEPVQEQAHHLLPE